MRKSLIAVLLLVGCSRPDAAGEPGAGVEPPTGTSFAVHLQDGFTGQRVRLLVDGALVFEGRPQTDPRLGLAHAVAGRTERSSVEVTLEREDGPPRSGRFDLAGGVAIGVSLEGAEIVMRQAPAFGYD